MPAMPAQTPESIPIGLNGLAQTHQKWGRFCLIRPKSEFTMNWGLLKLREIRPADYQAPDQVIESSTVLWSRQEAFEAERVIFYFQSCQK